MIDFTVETQIARPVHEVFTYAVDPDRLSSWQTNTVRATREDTGPYGVGSRLREVHRAPGGKELESVVEVVEYVPDRVRFRAHGNLSGPTRLMEPLLGRVLREQFAQNVANLKQVLEGASVAA